MTSLISLTDKRERRFRNLVLVTVIIIYLLILAGGIVRSTGSGMGCPDWPKCFGRWVPPTEISQLPNNYQKIYGAKLKGEIEFNAIKTWIEYVNRLLGVLSGFFVFGTLLGALSYFRKDKAIFLGSLTSFLLIGANGWLGSRVVATELAQHVITLHLLLAIAVVFALLFVLVRLNAPVLQTNVNSSKNASVRWILFMVMALTLVQIILGTQVRETLDIVVKQLGYEQRENWVNHLDVNFYIHRSFSIIVLVIQIASIYQLRKVNNMSCMPSLSNGLITLVIVEIGTGVIMAYFNVPAIAQPIHLLLALIIIGLQFVAWLLVNPAIISNRKLEQTAHLAKV